MDEDSIKVTYIKDKETQIEKDLSWPQEFDAFIQAIREKFGFEDKNTKVNLKVVTYDEDDYTIESQQNLQRYIDNDDIKEFKFTIEIKKDDTKDFTDGEKDKEFEKLIDDLIKEDEEKEQDLDIDEMIKDVFGNENYEEKLKKERDKLTDSFNQTFEKKVSDLLTQKSKIMQEKISAQLSSFSNLFLDQQKEVKNSFADMRANSAEIKDQTEDMSTGINELLESVQKKELIIIKADDYNKLVNHKKTGDIIQNEEPKIINQKPANNFNPNPIEFFGEQIDQKLSIKFLNKNIEKILDIKEAKFINIDNIEIKNIGNEPLNHLILVRDDDNSSNDIFIFGNSANPKELELTMPGAFDINDSQKFNISLKINYPKPNHTYKMVLYVREKNNDNNLSEPLEIIIKIKQNEEDPMKQKIQQATQIYEELKNEFHDYENLIDKNDIINQLLNNNFNKEEIKNSLNLKIEKIKQEEKEKENKNKIEEILNQLNFHDDNEFKMDEIRALIKQNDFNKEKVQNWINGQLCKKIYNKLTNLDDVDITKVSKDEVFQKIIELNFKIDEIKILYPKNEEKVVNPVVQPANNENAGAADNENAGDEDEEEVNKIYIELEDDYGISGYIEEELAKLKIRELKLDRDAIIEWIENSLVSGNN